MSWSKTMREARSARRWQMDMFDQQVLSYELFAGEEGDRVVVENRMRVTRKVHPCCVCFENIQTGTRCRAQSEINRDDNIAATFYVCPTCCDAAAKSRRDDGEAIQRRWEMGFAAAAGTVLTRSDELKP